MAVRRTKAKRIGAPQLQEVRLVQDKTAQPRGSRNRIGERFIAALCSDFEVHGADVIARVREEDAAIYLRVVAQIVPQTLLMQDAKLDDLSDDELATYLLAIREALGAREDAADGAGAAEGNEAVESVSSVSEAKAVS
jgi:hypothetical protein